MENKTSIFNFLECDVEMKVIVSEYALQESGCEWDGASISRRKNGAGAGKEKGSPTSALFHWHFCHSQHIHAQQRGLCGTQGIGRGTVLVEKVLSCSAKQYCPWANYESQLYLLLI